MINVMSTKGDRPETEVPEKARRRRFSAEYKRRILAEAARSTERGALGALLRREGLYSSHLSKWKEQAAAGEFDGLRPKKRDRKASPVATETKQIAALQRQNAALLKRAERAEALVEVQKKVSQLLGIALPTPDEDE
jgi:transposase-like protein